ncbi:MAG: CAP domain-containing protein [Mesorhizobium sp.]|uniref:CAP domain-containing protein n=1 Tax=Mesorhizobium sp. TaxID=1871066 RepID=UPI000FE83E1A|nr:CAP domain-containing protein [Mesorhizobium sp.]RWH79340.1 MAG: CAP domain-containing protein [Mesorhizobium sp.]RWH81869.1 MAG: CAP domain-containing protein [Mesorhizobium sp.]RWH88135.1 MAG: CAP domain-containing protein [Mesorhizobium sp.]RWH92815.1 MAG: CAP domain-containing protein [Mesorhizobium sp.]RWI01541.1 MAG: CAP domain-containing protein [Mesorhizobium sp.]
MTAAKIENSEARSSLNRRMLLRAAGLAALAGLAACATVLPTGEGAGVSASAVGTLAGIRASAGLEPLVPDPQLEQAALQQSGYMARGGRMTHSTGWGKGFAARVKGNGIAGAAAENIAEGRFDQRKLFDIWMHSAGHRRNMLDPRFTRFGLAYVRDGRDSSLRYWSLVLGK